MVRCGSTHGEAFPGVSLPQLTRSRGGGGPVQCDLQKAVSMVRGHLSAVDESMHLRQPSRLERALQDANGTKYLKTVSMVRKSRGTSDLHRHALESAMASHLVRARSTLLEWKRGVREISDACSERDVDKIKMALQHYKFAEDEQAVCEARAQLRWLQYIEKTLPPLLKEATADRDVKRLRDGIGEMQGRIPLKLEGLSEAMAMLHKADGQIAVLNEAMGKRNKEDLQKAIAAWEFKDTEPAFQDAQQMLEAREEALLGLQQALEDDPPRGEVLRVACDAWLYERNEPDFVRASKLRVRYDQALHQLATILESGGGQATSSSSPPTPSMSTPSPKSKTARKGPNVEVLRTAVEEWCFADVPQELVVAREVLEAVDNAFKAALLANDGWTLFRLQRAGGMKPAFADRATKLVQRHERAVEVLHRAVLSAVAFEAAAEPDISRLVHRWAFDDRDPSVDFARRWLSIRRGLGDRTTAELRGALEAALPGCARGALERRAASSGGGLPEDSELVATAEALCAKADEAQHITCQLALGAPWKRCSAAADFAAARSSAMAALARIKEADIAEARHLSKGGHANASLVEVVGVAAYLLAGISKLVPESKATYNRSWPDARTVSQLLADDRFLQALCDVPPLLDAGYLPGLAAAFRAWQKVPKPQATASPSNSWPALALYLHQFSESLLVGARFIVARTASQRVAGLDTASAAALRPRGDLRGPSRKYSIAFRAAAHAAAVAGDNDAEMLSAFTESWPLRSIKVERSSALEAFRGGMPGTRACGLAWTLLSKDVHDLKRRASLAGATMEAAQKARHAYDLEVEKYIPSGVPREARPLRRGQPITVKVQLLSGEEVLTTEVVNSSTGVQLKELVAVVQNIPADEQRLLLRDVVLQDDQALSAQGVLKGSVITMERVPPPLFRRTNLCLAALSDIDMMAEPTPALEIAAHIIWGETGVPQQSKNAMFSWQSMASREKLRQAMVSALTKAVSVLDQCVTLQQAVLDVSARTSSKPRNDKEPKKKAAKEPRQEYKTGMLKGATVIVGDCKVDKRAHTLLLSNNGIKEDPSRLPLQQLCVAKRALAAARSSGEPVECLTSEFTQVMIDFYTEFLPLRSLWHSSIVSAAEAEMAFEDAEGTAAFVAGLKLLGSPSGGLPMGSMKQMLVALGKDPLVAQVEGAVRGGVPLPGPHVSRARRLACDTAQTLLDSPPDEDPESKLRWTQALLSTILAPAEFFGNVAGRITAKLTKEDLAAFLPGQPSMAADAAQKETEAFWVLLAVAWLLRSDSEECPPPTAAEVRRLLANPANMLEALKAWSPTRNMTPSAIAGPAQLVLSLWDAMSVSRLQNASLQTLYAWSALVVSMAPLVEYAHDAAFAHEMVIDAIAKLNEQPLSNAAEAPEAPGQATLAMELWAQVRSGLYVPEEPWWWLRIAAGDPPGRSSRCELFYMTNGLAPDDPDASMAPVPQEQLRQAASAVKAAADAAQALEQEFEELYQAAPEAPPDNAPEAAPAEEAAPVAAAGTSQAHPPSPTPSAAAKRSPRPQGTSPKGRSTSPKHGAGRTGSTSPKSKASTSPKHTAGGAGAAATAAAAAAAVATAPAATNAVLPPAASTPSNAARDSVATGAPPLAEQQPEADEDDGFEADEATDGAPPSQPEALSNAAAPQAAEQDEDDGFEADEDSNGAPPAEPETLASAAAPPAADPDDEDGFEDDEPAATNAPATEPQPTSKDSDEGDEFEDEDAEEAPAVAAATPASPAAAAPPAAAAGDSGDEFEDDEYEGDETGSPAPSSPAGKSPTAKQTAAASPAPSSPAGKSPTGKQKAAAPADSGDEFEDDDGGYDEEDAGQPAEQDDEGFDDYEDDEGYDNNPAELHKRDYSGFEDEGAANRTLTRDYSGFEDDQGAANRTLTRDYSGFEDDEFTAEEGGGAEDGDGDGFEDDEGDEGDGFDDEGDDGSPDASPARATHGASTARYGESPATQAGGEDDEEGFEDEDDDEGPPPAPPPAGDDFDDDDGFEDDAGGPQEDDDDDDDDDDGFEDEDDY